LPLKATLLFVKSWIMGNIGLRLLKRKRRHARNSVIIDVKEVRLSASIEEHDMGVKAKHADKFLRSGDKVKVTIRFRGREMAHREIGFQVMEKFTTFLTSDMVIERNLMLEGRSMIMILAPKE
jgi:translation initiation factor IF-3